MKILLTGANGHLGANTTRQLLERGHEVVAFVRQTSDLRGLEGCRVQMAFGDVTNLNSLIEAAYGVDVIIHTATHFAYWAKNPEDIKRPAMIGAKNIVKAAQQAGVQRLVYTSSSWAIGLVDEPTKILTGADWNEHPHSYYQKLKLRVNVWLGKKQINLVFR